jgi:hypothetical protein
VVRRIPDLNPSGKEGQETLFDNWRFHAFFTPTNHHVADTVVADKITVATRSSSRSTPTSRAPRWLICRPGSPMPTQPGSCWP